MTKTGKKVPKIHKEEEFLAFIETVKGDTVAYWSQIAQALGVNKDTITLWKNHPLAKKAIREGIEKNLAGMQKSGKKDWRMWESKVKMLGVAPIEKQDITSGGEKVRPILGGISRDETGNSDKETSKTPKEN